MKSPKLLLGVALLTISGLFFGIARHNAIAESYRPKTWSEEFLQEDARQNESQVTASCSSLNVVGGVGTEVMKKVTPPSLPFFHNNWNTDFSVDRRFDYYRYVATFMPDDDGQYAIKMYLKYSNNTDDRFYDQKVKLAAGQPFTITATSRRDEQPYQINIFVGDLVSVGKTYKLTVDGCW